MLLKTSLNANFVSSPVYPLLIHLSQQSSENFSLQRLQSRERGMKSKLMQGQGFKHPIKINLSAVIDLTRGFLMLFKVFWKMVLQQPAVKMLLKKK